MTDMLSPAQARRMFPAAFEECVQRIVAIAEQTGLLYSPMCCWSDGAELVVMVGLDAPCAGLSDTGAITIPLGTIN